MIPRRAQLDAATKECGRPRSRHHSMQGCPGGDEPSPLRSGPFDGGSVKGVLPKCAEPKRQGALSSARRRTPQQSNQMIARDLAAAR